MKRSLIPFFLLFNLAAPAQEDTAVQELVNATVLSEVVIRNDLDVARFLRRVKEDTSFYKAFRNLRILGYTSVNHIEMLDKKGRLQASLHSQTKQKRESGCRTMEVLEEETTGDMYAKGELNYYTARLYASLFFTRGKICGENNIVAGIERQVRNRKGIDKHKEQLKMMFFNPGKKIPGIPFIGDKIDIFSPGMARYYDFRIDMDEKNGLSCYVFDIIPKADLTGGQKDRIVFDRITTWFDAKTMEIVARDYAMSYNTPVYDFDVRMEVQLSRWGGWLLPTVLQYSGEWKVAFKKRERGRFTATLSGFSAGD